MLLLNILNDVMNHFIELMEEAAKHFELASND